jgi:hypothetical protein
MDSAIVNQTLKNFKEQLEELKGKMLPSLNLHLRCPYCNQFQLELTKHLKRKKSCQKSMPRVRGKDIGDIVKEVARDVRADVYAGQLCKDLPANILRDLACDFKQSLIPVTTVASFLEIFGFRVIGDLPDPSVSNVVNPAGFDNDVCDDPTSSGSNVATSTPAPRLATCQIEYPSMSSVPSSSITDSVDETVVHAHVDEFPRDTPPGLSALSKRREKPIKSLATEAIGGPAKRPRVEYMYDDSESDNNGHEAMSKRFAVAELTKCHGLHNNVEFLGCQKAKKKCDKMADEFLSTVTPYEVSKLPRTLKVHADHIFERMKKGETVSVNDQLIVQQYLSSWLALHHCQRKGVIEKLKVSEYLNAIKAPTGEKIVGVTEHNSRAHIVLCPEEDKMFEFYLKKIRPNMLAQDKTNKRAKESKCSRTFSFAQQG